MGWMGAPTALTFAAATLGWLLFGVLPGFLLASALAPGRSALDRLAVAPAVSIGVAYSVAAWTNVAGLSAAVPVAAASLLVVALASATLLLRRRVTGGPGLWHDAGALRQALPAVVLVVVIWVVAIATSTTAWGVVAPYTDGSTHGLLVVDILQSGRVLGHDGYPAGVHVVAAVVGAVTSLPSALVVPLTVGGGTWLILGVAAFAARISAGAVRWAALAALAAPYVLYRQADWGGIPLVVAVALVPAVALAVLDAGRGWSCLVAALAVGGIVAVHVTEVLVVALLVALVLVARRAPDLRRLLDSAVAGAAGLVLVAPLVGELAAGGGDRTQDPVTPVAGPVAAAAAQWFLTALFRPYVGAVPTTPGLWVVALLAASALLVLSVIGAVVAWRVPVGRAVVLLALLSLVLSTVAAVTSGVTLTAPWYGNGGRLVAQLAALVPVLVGVGAERVVVPARTRGESALVGILVGTAGCISVAGGAVAAQQALDHASVVTAGDRAAFAWLEAHVPSGDEVLNDHRDGSVWMVDASRGALHPVFEDQPGGGFAAYPEWADRLYLQAHVAGFEDDPRARAVAAQWHVHYVFVGSRTFAGWPRSLDVGALERASGVREVFSSGGAQIFELPAT